MKNQQPLELAGLDPVTGEVPASRVADVDAARSIYLSLKKADEGSSRNRALIDGMFSGAPPFNANDLKEVGQGDRTNLDFGEAAALKEQALAGYYDLTNSVDKIARVRTSYGTPEQAAEWSEAISEEFHHTLKEWSEFEFNHQRLSDMFVSHGVAISYFEDEIDWRYRVTGFNEFRIPRGTRASEGEIEVATVDREYRADELFSFIRDPKVAEELGWDVKTVREALKRACASDTTTSLGDWERLEVELKNNDILWGTAKSKVVKVVHMWVKEFCGCVTHLIFLQEPLPTDPGATKESFLYRKEDRFESPTQCWVTFCYGVGNGTYHGIRGLGFKIYPHIQVLNRLRCGMVDGALLSSSLIVQPSDSSTRALDDLTLTYYGPYALFPPGLKIVEKAVPNLQQNIIPVINDMAMQMQNNTGAYQTRVAGSDNQARTAYEVRAQLQKEAILSSASINLFYHPWKRLLNETYRRLARRGYSANEPGGREAVEFRKRCLKRGVPEEAIYRVRSVEPVRAIGYGSPQMRMAAVDETMQIFGSLDEMGRINLLRDRIAARFGQEVVDRYLPSPNTALRPPIDAKIAILENATLVEGNSIPVSPGENHFLHAQAHLQAADGLEKATVEGRNNPQEALLAMQMILPHLAQHLAALGSDLVRKDEIAMMRQRHQQLAASAQRIEDELRAQMENAQKAQQAEAERQQTAMMAEFQDMQQKIAEMQQLSPEAQQKLLERRAELEMRMQKHEIDMKIKADAAQQKLMTQDAVSAAKIKSLVPSAAAPATAIPE
jgi:hypothetical protein